MALLGTVHAQPSPPITSAPHRAVSHGAGQLSVRLAVAHGLVTALRQLPSQGTHGALGLLCPCPLLRPTPSPAPRPPALGHGESRPPPSPGVTGLPERVP